MKHAIIVPAGAEAPEGKYAEAELAEGRRVRLAEKEYTPEELEIFRAEAPKWLLRRSGVQQFTADSDSGEDARGYFCKYFDWLPEKAVFEDGRLVGFFLSAGWLRYSGNGRASFGVDDWGYPGYDPFVDSWSSNTYVFLFSEAGSQEHDEWKLVLREPWVKYESCLEF